MELLFPPVSGTACSGSEDIILCEDEDLSPGFEDFSEYSPVSGAALFLFEDTPVSGIGCLEDTPVSGSAGLGNEDEDSPVPGSAGGSLSPPVAGACRPFSR